jgi:hypothetical protein
MHRSAASPPGQPVGLQRFHAPLEVIHQLQGSAAHMEGVMGGAAPEAVGSTRRCRTPAPHTGGPASLCQRRPLKHGQAPPPSALSQHAVYSPPPSPSLPAKSHLRVAGGKLARHAFHQPRIPPLEVAAAARVLRELLAALLVLRQGGAQGRRACSCEPGGQGADGCAVLAAARADCPSPLAAAAASRACLRSTRKRRTAARARLAFAEDSLEGSTPGRSRQLKPSGSSCGG